MAAVKKKTAYHHGDLRAHLVEATRQLVEEKGPEKFSVSDACRLAGVSTAAPYKHFKDKQDMVVAAAENGMRRLADRMISAMDGIPQGSIDSISAIGQVYVAFARSEPGLFKLMFGMTKDHDTHPEMVEAGMRCYGVLLNQVRQFYSLDDINEQVHVISFSLWSFVHGLSFLHIDDKVSQERLPIDVNELIADQTRRVLTG